jgi:hypothetical protein
MAAHALIARIRVATIALVSLGAVRAVGWLVKLILVGLRVWAIVVLVAVWETAASTSVCALLAVLRLRSALLMLLSAERRIWGVVSRAGSMGVSKS